jgi:hypothetical protein
MRLLLLPLLAACAGSAGNTGDDSAAAASFCDALTDGGTTYAEAVGGNATSGDLEIKVITDQADDVHEPLYVAFKDYTLENAETGGVQTTGKTSSDGIVDELLGSGTWNFQASYTRGSTVCTADLSIVVDPESTAYGCAVMTCP